MIVVIIFLIPLPPPSIACLMKAVRFDACFVNCNLNHAIIENLSSNESLLITEHVMKDYLVTEFDLAKKFVQLTSLLIVI